MSISLILAGTFAVASLILTAIMKAYKFGPFLEKDMTSTDNETYIDLSTDGGTVVPPKASPQDASKPPTSPLTTPDFSTPQNAFHSTRVLCDEMGLTYGQKNILCACVFQESEFHVNPRPNQNKDPKTGQVWSTDYGIVQVNDHFHIGKGKDFPSVQYVLDNPEACIRWMIGIYKATGALQPWSSFSTGAYKKWLLPLSPMWLLK